jgi:hypothetical protein
MDNKTFDEIRIWDFAQLQRTLTKEDIEVFGVLSGDMNPTHFSDEYARMLLDRHKVVGHSMWGGALISSLLGNDLPGPGTIYRSQNFEFHKAVELGDALCIITDAAINIYPNLEVKADIVKNAIQLAMALDIKQPKVAILSAVETVNPKIQATLDAAALCKMADRGQIEGAMVDGPLAFDNAVSKQAAVIKGIRSPVAGEADILLTPDLEAGNMLAKQFAYLSKADSAGIVLGARVPIMLTSRADSAEARLASCAVATAYARWLHENRKAAY